MPAPPDYIDVAERIVEFRATYPDGSLQQVGLQFIDFAGKSWVVYTAAAYRTPDDERPGHGTAWEPVPGPTNFTKDSELQNAETSAWGRALVAVLAADTKRGVASANEVRNRQGDGQSNGQANGAHSAPPEHPITTIRERIKAADLADAFVAFLASQYEVNKLDELSQDDLLKVLSATATEDGLARIGEYAPQEAGAS